MPGPADLRYSPGRRNSASSRRSPSPALTPRTQPVVPPLALSNPAAALSAALDPHISAREEVPAPLPRPPSPFRRRVEASPRNRLVRRGPAREHRVDVAVRIRGMSTAERLGPHTSRSIRLDEGRLVLHRSEKDARRYSNFFAVYDASPLADRVTDSPVFATPEVQELGWGGMKKKTEGGHLKRILYFFSSSSNLSLFCVLSSRRLWRTTCATGSCRT